MDYSKHQSEYWQTIRIGDDDVIEVRLTTQSLAGGWLTLSLYPEFLAHSTVRTQSDDTEALTALADALSYIRLTTGQLLGETHQLLWLRGVNNYRQSHHGEHADVLYDWYMAIGEPVRLAFDKNRKRAQKRLAGERTVRGGSDPRLKENELDVLHVQYDALRKIGRKFKADCNKVLKRFAKVRGAKGYTQAQWQCHWRAYCDSNYPEELREMARTFGRIDRPSASEFAFRRLAQMTGHKLSYLPSLVTKSRKLRNSKSQST